MLFTPPKKRTDNPCTCMPTGTHPTENPADIVIHHSPTCLSLYPKQPAPGDVSAPSETSDDEHAVRAFLGDGEAPCSCAGTVDGDSTCLYCGLKEEARAAFERLMERLAASDVPSQRPSDADLLIHWGRVVGAIPDLEDDARTSKSADFVSAEFMRARAEEARLLAAAHARDAAHADLVAVSSAVARGAPLPECGSAGGIVISRRLAEQGAEIQRLREEVDALSVEARTQRERADAAEADLARLQPSGQVAEDAKELREFIIATDILPRPLSNVDRLAAGAQAAQALASVTMSALGLSHAAHDGTVAAADCRVGMCPKYVAALRLARSLP